MILIHTYGKVASQSLVALLSRDFELRYSHGLHESTEGVVERFFATHPVASEIHDVFRQNDATRARLTAAARAGEDVTILCGVRDPIARSQSAMVDVLFRLLPDMFADCRGDDARDTGARLATRLAEIWMEGAAEGPAAAMKHFIVKAPLTWMRDEIEALLGFEVATLGFDPGVGYAIQTRGDTRLLIYRQESAPRAIEAGLHELFPDKTFDLPCLNAAATKDEAYREVYKALVERFRLPRDVLESIYANPYVRPFYDDGEATAAIARWQGPVPASRSRPARQAASVAASPEVRATILIPALNRGAYVGAAIRSVLRQWDDRFQLLVIDDGSTDDTSRVAREAVDHHAGVDATLLRTAGTLGLGLVPTVLRHARSDIIIQCDSDDIALPGRLDKIARCFERDPSCRLVTSNAVLVTEDLTPVGLYNDKAADRIDGDPLLEGPGGESDRRLGATQAFHRKIFEDFPPLDTDLVPYGLDLILDRRATLTGTHHYLCEPLVLWRHHADNMHKVAGARSSDTMRERYCGLELMAFAQRLRDIDSRRHADPHDPVLTLVKAREQDHFMARFADWSRLRNRRPSPVDAAGDSPPLPMPPVVTLAPGRREPFAAGRRLGTAASEWSGFYEAEEGHQWTSRLALIVLRRSSTTARTLRLAFRALPGRARARLSINFVATRDLEFVGGEPITEVELDLDVVGEDLSFTLLMEALDPRVPSLTSDTRLLGLCLLSLELLAEA